MRIGFTGTREGMTPQQLGNFVHLIVLYRKEGDLEFFHGDCVGADAEAHYIVNAFRRTSIDIFPPKDDTHRAFCKGDSVRNLHVPKTHFERNRDIVDGCKILIGTPLQEERQKFGGTWYTIDYALKKKRKTHILYQSGKIETKS